MVMVGVAELKARLAKYLRQVKSGNEILITERGSPVAKLVPIDATQKRDDRRRRPAVCSSSGFGWFRFGSSAAAGGSPE